MSRGRAFVLRALPGALPRALVLALLAALWIVACAKPAPAPPDAAISTITIEEVAARLGQPGFYLYDANPKDMYAAGHVPGATWVKFDAVTREELPPSRDATLVFYCANELCTASHEAARQAMGFGFSHVFVMNAGYFGWKRAGRPLSEPHTEVTAPGNASKMAAREATAPSTALQ